jgi:hypothetical protein
LVSAKPRVYSQRWMYGSAVGYAAIITSTHSAFLVSPTFQMLNFIEPPWWGPVCPVVWEGRSREAPPIPIPGRKPPDSSRELWSLKRPQCRLIQTAVQLGPARVIRFLSVRQRPNPAFTPLTVDVSARRLALTRLGCSASRAAHVVRRSQSAYRGPKHLGAGSFV